MIKTFILSIFINCMLYVSLGSNCSVSYQLNKRNLKFKSFPFDWCKISINQLIDVLENNFYDYVDTIFIDKISYNHHSNDNINYSIILKNKYNIIFAHEITNESQLNIFKNKLVYRINNFTTFNDKIIFIRIELKPIKKSYEIYIFKLIQLLNKFSNDFILKLILNTNIQFNDFPSNIEIYKYHEFNPDWHMDNIDWNNIIEL